MASRYGSLEAHTIGQRDDKRIRRIKKDESVFPGTIDLSAG
jgi:hypothetical protein